MAEPTSGAALAGAATAIPAAAIAGTVFGVPYELLAWGFFGGLIAVANVERNQEGVKLAVQLAAMLAIAAGVGGAFGSLAADVLTGVASKFIDLHLTGAADPRLVRCASIVLGAATALIPDGYQWARGRLKGSAA